MYVGFIHLENAYDRVNKEALWQVLRMYDLGSKRFSGIKSMYVDSSAYVRVRVESCTRQYLCLVLCMVVRQCYGKKRRDLE